MRGLQIEILKLKRTANFVMLGLILLIVVGIALITFHSTDKVHLQVAQLYSPMLWGMQSSFVNFILVVFIIMNIGKEYSDNTLRRTIIDGFTRDEFFKSKLWVLLLSVAFIYFIQVIVLLAGGFISGQSAAVTEYLAVPVLINTFVKLLSVGIIAFFLTFLTRSIAISIVIYFVWSIIESILVLMEKYLTSWSFNLKDYLPVSSIDNAVSNNMAVQSQTIIVATVYLLIMLMISYFLLLKRDIK